MDIFAHKLFNKWEKRRIYFIVRGMMSCYCAISNCYCYSIHLIQLLQNQITNHKKQYDATDFGETQVLQIRLLLSKCMYDLILFSTSWVFMIQESYNRVLCTIMASLMEAMTLVPFTNSTSSEYRHA
mmetsp:Transcript_23409/g.30578  ORF Transcript_23409/g.30578 Transcript_23409/m.30578 type:complete len:127 (-) Transcript_23409:365-745(-)